MEKTFNLLGDRILLEVINKTQNTAFILQETVKDKPNIGKVIYIGNGKVKNDTFTTNVKVNDTIIFQQWSGNEVKIEDKKYICIKFEIINI